MPPSETGSGPTSDNNELLTVTNGGTLLTTDAAIQPVTITGSTTLGSSASGWIVASGGSLDVLGIVQMGFGSALGFTVQSGGSIETLNAMISGTVLSGGTATIGGVPNFGPGVSIATQVLSGGVLEVVTFGSDSGTTISSGGREVVGLDTSVSDVVIAGGTLELTYGLGYRFNVETAQAGPLTFSGNGGTLRDDGPTPPSGAITGFNATDRILFPLVPADPNASLTVSGDMVTVSASGQAYTMDIVGASSIPLTLGIGTMSGTIDIGIACYCAGTAILTAEGEVPVETIAPGDLVITADGRAEPVVWVGRRSYEGRFLRGRSHLLPVRIRAGALGRRLPRRDLLVSPNHALLLDGVLVPAEALVGLPGITVEHGCDRVEYVHVELARHDVILAEGAPAETFLDDSSRGIFQASEGVPGDATTFCAPRLADGFELEAIRRRLAA